MKRLVWKSLPVQAIAVVLLAVPVAGQSKTTVLVDVDHRKAMSLNGDWHYIVDPYDGGLYDFHREIRKDGFFLDGAPETGSDGLIEYDFSKSPTRSMTRCSTTKACCGINVTSPINRPRVTRRFFTSEPPTTSPSPG